MNLRYDLNWQLQRALPKNLTIEYFSFDYRPASQTLYAKDDHWVYGRVYRSGAHGTMRNVVIDMKNRAGDCFEFDIGICNSKQLVLNSFLKLQPYDIQQPIAEVMRELELLAICEEVTL